MKLVRLRTFFRRTPRRWEVTLKICVQAVNIKSVNNLRRVPIEFFYIHRGNIANY